ncbi:DNA alkylation repair protein [Candidatus Pacearchaeota archaeon]|nr:DNA alkylation repair protein [Candidatus Pacearchaeota archaeon]
MLSKLKTELESLANPEQAKILQRFFKTGEGQYGEGDIFLGIKVPVQRQIAKKYDLNLNEIQDLLNSEIHEHRLVGLFTLIGKYNLSKKTIAPLGVYPGRAQEPLTRPQSTECRGKEVFDFYLANTKNINNWDLVDVSAHKIVGDFLYDKKKEILYELAKSDNLWERRIAIISTFAFIKREQFDDSLAIAEILLKDNHDLIHKAVGWMLREVGKRDVGVLKEFLKQHYKNMPRTMLRYAIEKFEEGRRKKYLKGEI